MTRLIDADALLTAINLLYIENNSDRVRMEELIDKMPTVQREGWVSVPIEPTYDMVQAMAKIGKENEKEFRNRFEGAMLIYKAMISAAPKE